MSAHAAAQQSASTYPIVPGLIPALWIRTIVLIASGAAIAFTATQHSDAQFSLMTLGVSLVLLGAATSGEYVTLRRTPAAWLLAARALLTIAAGVTLLVLFGIATTMETGLAGTVAQLSPSATSQFAMLTAIVIAIWAALTAVITCVRAAKGTQPRNIALPSAALSVLLALFVLLFRDDFVAIIGFFGAYAIVRAVFLGIAVFDMKSPAEAHAAAATA